METSKVKRSNGVEESKTHRQLPLCQRKGGFVDPCLGWRVCRKRVSVPLFSLTVAKKEATDNRQKRRGLRLARSCFWAETVRWKKGKRKKKEFIYVKLANGRKAHDLDKMVVRSRSRLGDPGEETDISRCLVTDNGSILRWQFRKSLFFEKRLV